MPVQIVTAPSTFRTLGSKSTSAIFLPRAFHISRASIPAANSIAMPMSRGNALGPSGSPISSVGINVVA
jgi:hypothetical protein